MDYTSRNLKALKNKRMDYYDSFFGGNSLCTKAAETTKIEKCETLNREATLIVERRQEKRRLNSLYNPREEAVRWARNYEFPNIHSIIHLFGLGNGIFLEELMKKKKEGDVIIVYEPSYLIFKFCLQNFDLSKVFSDKDVYLIVKGINENQFKLVFEKTVNEYNLHSQYGFQHRHYREMFPEQYEAYQKKIEEFSDIVTINQNTVSYFGKPMIKNMFENIRYIRNSNLVADYCNVIPEEIPVFIVAAGPSLEKNGELLKKAKGRSIIIAVDTAISYLQRQNIVPDLLITIDALKPLKLFEGEYIKSVPLIAIMHSRSEVLQLHEGKKIFYDNAGLLRKIYDDMGIFPEHYSCGGSVATAAFSVCCAWKRKRIILVGQDLAYDGNVTHIGGVTETYEVRDDITEVEGVQGGIVKTRTDWYTYLRWYEDAIGRLNGTDVIDVKESGAKIKGTRSMSLEDVINQYCNIEFSLSELINNTSETLNEKQQRQVFEYLLEAERDLTTICSKSREAIGLLEQITLKYKHNGSGRAIEKLAKRIAQIGEEIERKKIYSEIEAYLGSFSAENLGGLFDMESAKEDEAVKTYRMIKGLYEEMIVACDYIKPLLTQAINEY